MSAPSVIIVTPTYKRPAKIIDRCVRSVLCQSYEGNIHQVICSDSDIEPHVEEYMASMKDTINNYHNRSLEYCCVGKNTNTYGGAAREYVLTHIIDVNKDKHQYVSHVDDDNVLFPHFIEEHVDALEKNPDKGFSICKILHLGPLPAHLGIAPQVMSGIPPVLQNIDTLQAVIRVSAMSVCRWNTFSDERGYYNDGFTYDRLGKMFEWVEVPELLAVHI